MSPPLEGGGPPNIEMYFLFNFDKLEFVLLLVSPFFFLLQFLLATYRTFLKVLLDEVVLSVVVVIYYFLCCDFILHLQYVDNNICHNTFCSHWLPTTPSSTLFDFYPPYFYFCCFCCYKTCAVSCFFNFHFLLWCIWFSVGVCIFSTPSPEYLFLSLL